MPDRDVKAIRDLIYYQYGALREIVDSRRVEPFDALRLFRTGSRK
jgi:hypothetical protein